MLFKGFSIFRSGSHFVQWSRRILAVLVEGHPRNILVRIILISGYWSMRICRLKVFLFFSSSGLFVQRSETLLAIYVETYPRNISVKLF